MRINLYILLIFLTALSCSTDGKKHPITSNPDNGDNMEQVKDKLKYLALPEILKMLKEE